MIKAGENCTLCTENAYRRYWRAFKNQNPIGLLQKAFPKQFFYLLQSQASKKICITALQNSAHVLLNLRLRNSCCICICTSIHTHPIPTLFVGHEEFCTYEIKPETTNIWTTIKRNPHNCSRFFFFAWIGRLGCTFQFVRRIQSHKSETACTVMNTGKLIARPASSSSLFTSCVLCRKLIKWKCTGPDHVSPSQFTNN